MNSTIDVAVLVGSLRRGSFNAAIARALPALAPSGVAIAPLGSVGEFPLFNQDAQGQGFPPAVVAMGEAIAKADGVVIVTPEYNYSVPGVLKNALDHASRPYGQNAWAGKPGGVIGVSVGAIGSALAQQHLRNVLAYLDMPTLGQPEVFIQARDDLFNADGSIGAASQKFLQTWMDAYVAWVKRHTA